MGIDYEYYQYIFGSIFKWCGQHLLSLSDKELEWAIYEDYMFYYTDLLDEHLTCFLEMGFINKETVEKARLIRELSDKMFSPDEEFSANCVRTSKTWQKIFNLVDELKQELKFSEDK